MFLQISSQQNHIPILLLLPKLFFSSTFCAAEQFGREAQGKAGEETGKSLPRLPYEIMKRNNIVLSGYNLD